jgi:crotonobetaine/carnitine-CoA ligase
VELSYRGVIEFCVENMAYYMVPRYLQVVDELPKTPSEKIEKYKLKQDAASNLDQLWDREKAGVVVRRS